MSVIPLCVLQDGKLVSWYTDNKYSQCTTQLSPVSVNTCLWTKFRGSCFQESDIIGIISYYSDFYFLQKINESVPKLYQYMWYSLLAFCLYLYQVYYPPDLFWFVIQIKLIRFLKQQTFTKCKMYLRGLHFRWPAKVSVCKQDKSIAFYITLYVS